VNRRARMPPSRPCDIEAELDALPPLRAFSVVRPPDRTMAREIAAQAGISLPRSSRRRVPRIACVYFVRAGNDGLVKIGHSSDAYSRIEALAAGSPVELQVLAAVVGGRSLEQTLHRIFGASRHHGEWFEPTPALLRFIERLWRQRKATDT
jgi:hypothetical protein